MMNDCKVKRQTPKVNLFFWERRLAVKAAITTMKKMMIYILTLMSRLSGST
jgi:hypothetical protein